MRSWDRADQAPLRYLIDRTVQARYASAFPAGTLIVNMVGSLALGVVVGLPANPAVTALVEWGYAGR